MMTRIISALRAYFTELQDRHQLRALLAKDDRMLRDIGLTREDVEAALAKPIRVQARQEARRLSRLSFSLDRAV